MEGGRWAVLLVVLDEDFAFLWLWHRHVGLVFQDLDAAVLGDGDAFHGFGE